MLEILGNGINYGWAIARHGGYASSSQEAVHEIAGIGFDVVSAWLRDETLDSKLLDRIDLVRGALAEVDDFYRMTGEFEAQQRTTKG